MNAVDVHRLDAATGPAWTVRWPVALLLPIGPAAVAVLRYVLPYDTTDDTATMLTEVAAAPGTQSAVLWLGFVATLTLVPAAYWVGGLTRQRAPRLTTAALLLLVPGYLALPWLMSLDVIAWSAVVAEIGAPATVTLAETAHPALDTGATIFVVGHLAGTVLLGLALWVSRAIPRWAATLVIVSQPLHFVAAVVLSSHTLDLAAWGMQAVGFAAAAVAIVRGARRTV